MNSHNSKCILKLKSFRDEELCNSWTAKSVDGDVKTSVENVILVQKLHLSPLKKKKKIASKLF